MQEVQRLSGVQWIVVWDTSALMRDQWVGYQVLPFLLLHHAVPEMLHCARGMEKASSMQNPNLEAQAQAAQHWQANWLTWMVLHAVLQSSNMT